MQINVRFGKILYLRRLSSLDISGCGPPIISNSLSRGVCIEIDLRRQYAPRAISTTRTRVQGAYNRLRRTVEKKKKIKLFCQPSCLKVGSERGNKILLVYRSVSSSSSVTSVIAELILTVFPRTIAGN